MICLKSANLILTVTVLPYTPVFLHHCQTSFTILLTPSVGAVAQSKIYDGTTSAIILDASLVGVLGFDDVSVIGAGAFRDRNVGTDKDVRAALILSGEDSANYSLGSSPIKLWIPKRS